MKASAASVWVTGAGPAGSAAALAARAEGAEVTLYEKSRFPRHKVCGEFLTPEVAPALDRLGAWSAFRGLGPAPIRRLVLQFGSREKTCLLPEPAYGLSRYALDRLLYEAALGAGAVARETPSHSTGPHVLACGRRDSGPRGDRLFGFKAHFTGPVSDAVELFFFPGGYAGVSPVENGVTNVCGLAPEPLLRRFGFDPEALLRSWGPLSERLDPLERATRWFTAGPLVFRRPATAGDPRIYPAGDALGFIDPFTGTGIAAALITGRLAGVAAARGWPVEKYLGECLRALGRPFAAAALFRRALQSGWAEYLAAVVPARWLYRATRPA